jgi:hypothetical protein
MYRDVEAALGIGSSGVSAVLHNHICVRGIMLVMLELLENGDSTPVSDIAMKY